MTDNNISEPESNVDYIVGATVSFVGAVILLPIIAFPMLIVSSLLDLSEAQFGVQMLIATVLVAVAIFSYLYRYNYTDTR